VVGPVNSSTTLIKRDADEASLALPDDISMLVDLAFGSAGGEGAEGSGRHLSLLLNESLKQDHADPRQRRFGDYELLELIGEGGMGVVYRARQNSLNREVAVKLLAAGPWASREYVERFRREAQNAARMQHPNIVAIYEVGDAEELQFFSMRLVRGQSLAAQLQREGTLPPMRAAQLLRAIAEAVDYAHRLGVLHLDLKPANVLIDENGAPHVADFGVARRLDQDVATDNDEVSGTPNYMAPEQAVARGQLTTATDIWGLGAILYELVCGVPPFLGASSQATLQLAGAGAVRAPREHMPDLPRDLESIILKCTARRAADRYASAREVANELTRFVEHREVRARPLNPVQRALRWGRREPKLAAATLLSLVALIGGLAATTQQWRRAEASAESARNSAGLARERLWQARIDQAAIAIRDGHPYDSLPALATNIREREAEGSDAREDRIRFASVQRSAPRLIDAIAVGSDICGIAISPDGSQIAVATVDEALQLFDAGSGARLARASFAGATHFSEGGPIHLIGLSYSPDGRFLIGRNALPWTFVSPMGADEILFDATDGSAVLPPAARFPDFRDATYSADGAFALVRDTGQRAIMVRTAGWRPIGTAQAFDEANRGWMVPSGGATVVSSSNDFRNITIHDASTLAVRYQWDYSDAQRVTAWASHPDGTVLLVGHLDGSIERIDLVGGLRRSVSPSPIGRIARVEWSRDGHWFGAVADSGEVLVWDSSSGKLAAPLMRLSVATALRGGRLALDPGTRTVIAAAIIAEGDEEMALWWLADATTPPLSLNGQFPSRYAWYRAFAYDAAHGLVASDGGLEELRLWRLPPRAPMGLRTPPMPSPQLRAGDGRIVAVNGDTVQLVSASDRRPLSPRLELRQAAAFAELTADGTSLIASSGPELFVYDASKWILRNPPTGLPNDPARIVLSPDSRHALLTFADYRDGANGESAQSWDLYDGMAVSQPIALSWESGLRFGADGRSLLIWTRDVLQVVDGVTLKPRWSSGSLRQRLLAAGVAPVEDTRIVDATFSSDAARIEVLTTNVGHWGTSRLWQFDAESGVELMSVVLAATGGGESFAPLPGRNAVLVQRNESPPLFWDEHSGGRELGAMKGGGEFAALALSADARMFGRARFDSVILASADSLEWLAPPLAEGLAFTRTGAGVEFPAQLAFLDDGAHVIARSRNGEWLSWEISPDARPVDQLTRDGELLNQALPVDKRILPNATRKLLRAQDPGPPSGAMQPNIAAQPPRSADAPPTLVDLDGAYNSGFNKPIAYLGTHADVPGGQINFPEFVRGRHRFLGVDYDARGSIDLSMAKQARVSDANSPARVAGIRPAIRRFVALDLLVTGRNSLRSGQASPYAIVEISYRDGSRERLPIIYRRDVDRFSWPNDGYGDTVHARIAWRARNYGTPADYASADAIFAVHLVNPHPEREVDSLALEATDEAWSAPSFFAISLVPVDTAATRNASRSQ
jgi:WD40 repeat protein